MVTVIPGAVASADVDHLPREEAVLDEAVDVLAELRQPAAPTHGSEVEQRHHQGLGEALEALFGPLLTLHRLQVGEACTPRQSTAPDQTVAQDGPLEELTVGTGGVSDIRGGFNDVRGV